MFLGEWLSALRSGGGHRVTSRRHKVAASRRKRRFRLEERIERLEDRCLLADLAIQSVFLVDKSGNRISTVMEGQQFDVGVTFTTSAMNAVPVGQTWFIRFTADGVPGLLVPVSLDTATRQEGAGNAATLQHTVTTATNAFQGTTIGNQRWYATPGLRAVQVTLNPTAGLVETNTNNNSLFFTFTPTPAVSPPNKFIAPLGGVPFKDWSIVDYADLNPSRTNVDFLGNGPSSFVFSVDGLTGMNLAVANFAKMDTGVPVRAAADGFVVSVVDGNFDRQTTSSFNPQTNQIVIDHGGGWTTVYSSLLNGSVAVKPNDPVRAGQLIGLVGSSGPSFNPHLNFDVQRNGYSVETNLNSSVFFVNPIPYQNFQPTTLLDIGVTNDIFFFGELDERPTTYTTFSDTSGDTVRLWFRASHINTNDVVTVRWIRPDGATLAPVSQFIFPGRYLAPTILPNLPAATYAQVPGRWQVAVSVNNAEVGRTSFDVVSGVPGPPSVYVQHSVSQILDKRTTPIDFGSSTLGASFGTSQFISIENLGQTTLNISNLVIPAGYSVSSFFTFPTSVAPGTRATTLLTLDPSVQGLKFGQVRFDTNDPHHPNFGFNITGTVNGVPPVSRPTVSLPGPALAYHFGRPAASIDSTATLIDFDSATFNTGSLRVEFASGGQNTDRLSVLNQGALAGQVGVNGNDVTFGGQIIGTVAGGVGTQALVVLFNGASTPVAVEAVARAIAYSNVAVGGSTAPRYVRYTVTDDTGNLSNQAVTMVILGPDTVPTGALSASNITIEGGTSQTFTVQYSSLVPLITSTIGDGDLFVTGPNNYNQPAKFLGIDDTTNGTPRTATYIVFAPAGTWSSADNGTYIVNINANQITDVTNQQNFGGQLGTFDVDIPLPPDLLGHSFKLLNTPLTAGQSFGVEFEADNIGEATAPAFRVDFYASRDAVVDANDYFLGTYSVTTPLVSGTTSPLFSTTLQLPDSTNRFWTGDGPYYIAINLDGTGIFDEANKTNNNSQGIGIDLEPVIITGTAGTIAPDLVGTSFTALSKPYAAGASVNVNYQVSNIGNAPAGTSVAHFYLSTDSVITPNDHPLGTAAISALAPNGTTGVLQKSLSLPGFGNTFWTGDHNYFIGMLVDGGGTVIELIETNNSSQGLQLDLDVAFIVASAAPLPADLVGGNFTLGGTNFTAGSTVSIDYSVVNLGNGPAGPFPVDFYLSKDPIITADDLLLGSTPISGVPAGAATGTLQQTVTLPGPGQLFWAGSGDGIYYIGMIVDAGGNVLETDDSNNSSQGQGVDLALFSVQGTAGASPADLFGSFFSVSSTNQSPALLAGSVFNALFQVTNGGASGSSPFRVDFYLSKDAVIAPSDLSLGSFEVNPGIPANSSPGLRSIVLGLPTSNNPFWSGDGTYYIGMVVDGGQTNIELNEANNSSTGQNLDLAAAFIVGGVGVPKPDLRGGLFDIAAGTLTAGGLVDVNFKIENAGAAPTDPFQVDFYLNYTANVTGAVMLGSYLANSMPGNSTTTQIKQTLALPAPGDAFWKGDATYYIGMIIDSNGAITESNEINNNTQGLQQDVDSVFIQGTSNTPLTIERMFRAYNPTADYHFFTRSQAEFGNAVLHGYRDETTGKPGFSVLPNPAKDAVSVFRLYNPYNGRHYYTLSGPERDSLISLGWRYEKDEGFMFPGQAVGTTEIFRLYNKNSGVHLYTESSATRDSVLLQFPGVWVQHSSLGFAYQAAAGAPAVSFATSAPATNLRAESAAAPMLMVVAGDDVASTEDTSDASGIISNDAPEATVATDSTTTSTAANEGASENVSTSSESSDEDLLDSAWNQISSNLLASSTLFD